VLHAARCKYRTQEIVKKSPSGHRRSTLSGYIFAINARIDNRKKNLLSINISPTCLHNMMNFSPLAAEIDPVVWGTAANFNRFRVLAALLVARHSSIGRQPHFAALNRGRQLYSAGRPSRWALAHISSVAFFSESRTFRWACLIIGAVGVQGSGPPQKMVVGLMRLGPHEKFTEINLISAKSTPEAAL